ncbi:hypothetical protein ACMHYB_24570 [Sorangium sp. So ce1128]
MKMKTMLAFIGCAGGWAMAMLGLGCAQLFGFDKVYEPEGVIPGDGGAGGGGAASSAAGSGGAGGGSAGGSGGAGGAGGGGGAGGAGGGGAGGGHDAGGSGGAGAGAGDPCEILAVLPGETLALSMIDDMEDGDIRISRGDGANPRAGTWFKDNDLSEGGIHDPADSADLVSTLDPPRGASLEAMHSSADDGFVLWGAGVGFHLRDEAYYDASEYRGITFWARAEEGSTRRMRVMFIDQQTHRLGGICNEAEGRCSSHFHKHVVLESDWKHFKVPVECLKQEDYGDQFTAPALDRLWAIEFYFDKEQAFDIWIDDVAFYR